MPRPGQCQTAKGFPHARLARNRDAPSLPATSCPSARSTASSTGRVLENGLRIAEANGADREVVTLFALFHDSRRVNEDEDDGHGLRGAEFARSLRATWSTSTTTALTCCSRPAVSTRTG